jgi:hypothetical protein
VSNRRKITPDRMPKSPFPLSYAVEDFVPEEGSVDSIQKRDVVDLVTPGVSPARKRRRRNLDENLRSHDGQRDTPVADVEFDTIFPSRRSHTAIPVQDWSGAGDWRLHHPDDVSGGESVQTATLPQRSPLSPVTLPLCALPTNSAPGDVASPPGLSHLDNSHRLRRDKRVHSLVQASRKRDPAYPVGSPSDSRYGITASVLKERILIWRRGVPYPNIRLVPVAQNDTQPPAPEPVSAPVSLVQAPVYATEYCIS